MNENSIKNLIMNKLQELWNIIKNDFISAGFNWKTLLIICLFILASIIPRYHAAFPFNILSLFGLHGLTNFMNKIYITPSLIIQVIFPTLILLLSGYKISDFGWTPGEKKKGFIICGIFIIIYIPFFLILLNDPESQKYYSSNINAIKTPGDFFFKDSLPAFSAILKTEFLYRGLLLLGLRRQFGDFNANLLQNIPYVIAHSGKPELEALGSFIVGFALGYLALKTNSFWYGLLLHWLFASAFILVALLVI